MRISIEWNLGGTGIDSDTRSFGLLWFFLDLDLPQMIMTTKIIIVSMRIILDIIPMRIHLFENRLFVRFSEEFERGSRMKCITNEYYWFLFLSDKNDY